MKISKLFIWLITVSLFLMISSCGGGGGSDQTGEVTMSITDAKPLLPDGADRATNLMVAFTEILVHKSGGGWISLPLTGDLPSTTIDLLQFIDGNTTEIVPPELLEYGRYTQIRIIVSKAEISFDNGENLHPVVIPPEHLKTDKNFVFDVNRPTETDIVIDFDLSQSLVVTDPFGKPSYILKPVLHIADTSKAATINGKIAQGSFDVDQNAEVTVFVLNPKAKKYEEYTKIEVSKSDADSTEFRIYWLSPSQDYIVEIDFDPDLENGFEFSEQVNDLDPGEVRDLRLGVEI